jgi:hypothetical protein
LAYGFLFYFWPGRDKNHEQKLARGLAISSMFIIEAHKILHEVEATTYTASSLTWGIFSNKTSC